MPFDFLVQALHRRCRQFHILGQKYQITPMPRLKIANPPQGHRKITAIFRHGSFAREIAVQSCRFIHRTGVLPQKPQGFLGASGEKCTRCRDPIQTPSIF